jgi:hypothetical protein
MGQGQAIRQSGDQAIKQSGNQAIKQSSNHYKHHVLRFWVAASLILCFSATGYAAFPDIGISARPLGMGGAFTAVADDASAAFWNPAGLVQLGHLEVSSMYLNYAGIDNVSSQMLSGAIPLPWNSTLAGSLLQTGETDLYKEQTFLVSYGQDIYEYIPLPIAVGASLKRLSASYMNFDPDDPLFSGATNNTASTTGIAFALGVILQATPSLKFAAAFDNLASPNLALNTGDAGNTLNLAYRFGGAYTYRGKPAASGTYTEATFAAEFAQEELTPSISVSQLRVGTEVWFKNLGFADSAVALRAGVNNLLNDENARNLNVGGGYRFVVGETVGVQLDYAFSYFDTSQLNYHRVSLSLAY